MSRKKKYATEEERQAALKASRRKWFNANRDRYGKYKTFSIGILETEYDKHFELLEKHGYKTAGEFWRVCIKMLENNLIPDNPEPRRQTIAEINEERQAARRAAKLQAQALTPDPTTDGEPPKA